MSPRGFGPGLSKSVVKVVSQADAFIRQNGLAASELAEVTGLSAEGAYGVS